MARKRRLLLRQLTFWLRPDFVVRCLRRFQAVTGFDRAIALASLAFTAVIPVGIVAGSILTSADIGRRVVDRFDLEGDAAEAVQDLLGSSESVGSGLSLFGIFMIIVAVLSFARATQRLFETAWELPALSIRNSLNGLKWIAGLLTYIVVIGAIRSATGGLLGTALSLALIPVGIGFMVWTGAVLTNRRVPYAPLVPGAVLTTATLALYGFWSDLYVPDLFNNYASHYGAVGVTFALISWLFGVTLCVVASTAAGREVWDELKSIRRGERDALLVEHAS